MKFGITHDVNTVVPYLSEKIGMKAFMGQVFGLTKDNEVIAAFGFTDYNGYNVVSHVAITGKFLPRLFMWALGDYCFNVLGAQRVTATINETNTKSLRFSKHVGFVEEARLKRAASDGSDTVVMVLWPENYKWLEVKHG